MQQLTSILLLLLYNITIVTPYLLTGNAITINTYSLWIGIGTPMITNKLIIDTWSSTTMISGFSRECGNHLYINYNYIKSSTHEVVKCEIHKNCEFRIDFYEGSWAEGITIKDFVYFSTTSLSDKIAFGYITNENGRWYEQEDNGILGLGYDSSSNLSILNQWKWRRFSLCFGHWGGVLLFNESGASIDHKINRYSVPWINWNPYTIAINGIVINNKEIPFNSKAILDSGSTVSYWPKRLYEAVKAVFITEFNFMNNLIAGADELEICKHWGNQNEFNELYKSLPVLTYLIGTISGKVLEYRVYPEFYWYDLSNDSIWLACVGWDVSHFDYLIFGNGAWMHKEMEFQIDNSMLVIAQVNCDYHNYYVEYHRGNVYQRGHWIINWVILNMITLIGLKIVKMMKKHED